MDEGIFLLKIIIEEVKIINQTKYDLVKPDKGVVKLLVLNIMPNKVETEHQILSMCSNYIKTIRFTFLYPKSHHFKSDVLSHLKKAYVTLDDIKDEYYDGLLITGAPIETIEFEQVDYWQEFKRLLKWSKLHVKQSIYFCWASQAALYIDYGIKKQLMKNKIFGIFAHDVKITSPLLDGFGKTFYLPYSRYTTLSQTDILKQSKLKLLITSAMTGPQIIVSNDYRNTYITGHPEYGTYTLANEYFRDVKANIDPHIPNDYFQQNNPANPVDNYWHEAGVRLFTNWLNQIK